MLKVARNNPVFIYGVKPVDFPKTEIVFDFSDVLVYDLEKIAERIISGLINPEDKSQGTAWICAAAEGLRLPHERKKLYAISRAIGMNIELPTEIRENFRHFSEIWQQINRYLRGIDIIEREIQSVIDHKNRIYGVFVETNEKVYHIYLRKSADWVKFPVPKTGGFASNAKKRFIDYGSIGFIVFIQDKPE
jgi:hypothetical protein